LTVLALVGWVLCFSSGCGLLRREEPMKRTGYVIHDYESVVTGRQRQFAMYVPEDYNREPRRWPLILFLHGAGERGEDVDLVAKHGPIKEAIERDVFYFLVVAPQCPAQEPDEESVASAWMGFEEDILQILDIVESEYRVRTDMIYLTGLSMGGFGCFQLAAAHPNLFAAVAPICGGGDVQKAAAYLGTPFWVFHGQRDNIVPASRSIEMVEAMRQFGHEDVRLTLYPDLGHDAWSRTYSNPDLYAWFLRHQRKEP
jgi:predicted peptidase